MSGCAFGQSDLRNLEMRGTQPGPAPVMAAGARRAATGLGRVARAGAASPTPAGDAVRIMQFCFMMYC